MNATSPTEDKLPVRFTWRAYGRRVVDQFKEDWRQTNTPTRLYIVGILFVFSAAPLIRLHVADWWISGQMLAGAILASAGFVLEVYKLIDWLWDSKLGKLGGILLGTMVASIAMAMAQVIVNDATGIDPGHFPLTVAFIAPLTAGYLIAVLAWLAVLGGFLWFFAESLADMVRTGWAFGWGTKYLSKNPVQTGFRFVAVVVMSVLLAIMWGQGQRPYASFLSGTAQWFTFSLEMYGSYPCRLPNARLRRLSDDIVADGIVRPSGLTFQVRHCALADTIPTSTTHQ
jgi:hypothetical protein